MRATADPRRSGDAEQAPSTFEKAAGGKSSTAIREWCCWDVSVHLILLCALQLAQVLQRRVEPFTILPQALLAVIDVAIDLHHLRLKHVPVRLQRGEHVDEITLRVLPCASIKSQN